MPRRTASTSAAPQFNEGKIPKKIATVISKLRLISSSEHEKERNQSIYGNHGLEVTAGNSTG